MAELRRGTTIDGYLAWHAGNMGSGSGLDADTIKGYVPVNKTGDSMSGVLTLAQGSGINYTGTTEADVFKLGGGDIQITGGADGIHVIEHAGAGATQKLQFTDNVAAALFELDFASKLVRSSGTLTLPTSPSGGYAGHISVDGILKISNGITAQEMYAKAISLSDAWSDNDANKVANGIYTKGGMKTAGKIISTYGDSSNGVLEIKDQDSWVWKLTGYNIGQYWDTTNDILKMRNFYGKIQLIAGSAGTEGAVIEVANGGTLTVPGLSTLNGGVSITKDGDAITLNHSTATSYSGIKFNSKADITDNAYIRYYSDSSNFDSGIYDLTSSTENGLLIFGIENDEDGGGAGEVLALRGGNRVIIDVKTSHSGDQDTSEIVEFRYEGAVKSYIAANGKFMGSAETVDGKHSTDLVLLDGTQMMTGNLGFKNDAGGSVSMYKADGTTLLGKYRVDNTGAVVVSSDSGTNRTIVLRPSGADASANEFVVSGSGITYNANIVWHAGNFDPSTKSNTDHNHTYNVNDGWFRYLNDAATVRLFGNQRQMAFRTDGVTEYAVGVTPNPFTWQYGGDASTNSLMQISTAGGIWTKAYGWLGDYFLGKTAKAADSDKLDNLDSTDFLRSDNTSEQIISAGEVRIQSTTSTERMVMEFNETDSSLDFVYYTS